MTNFLRMLILGVYLLPFNRFAYGQGTDISQTNINPRFVNIKDLDSSIIVEARYAGSLNFTGKSVPGYEVPKCLLTKEAANALVKAQADLRPMGLSLKAYDCYRPQAAVTAFMSWAKGKDNAQRKRFFYPRENLEKLFERGYIAEKSGHSRGSTLFRCVFPSTVGKRCLLI